MAKLFYPLEACLVNATERQTAYVAADIHLYQSSLVPTETTTLAELTAAECDYDGYASQALTPWFDPILAPGSGYMTASPLVQFAYVDGVGHVSNLVGGAYIVDAGGDLRMVLAFTPTEYVTMAVNGQGLDINVADVFPSGF